jgi:hypothetical protein
MVKQTIGRALLAGVLVVAMACASEEQEAAGGAEATEMAMPDTTAVSLWSYLAEAEYATWPLWPEKGQLYTGTQPHGMLLTTYVNEAALTAVTNRTGTMPAGAMVVKENYMPDSTLAAVTVMYKVEGYNPEHGNWFFLKRAADGTVEVEGRGAGCQSCHMGQQGNDFLFTSSIQPQ